MKIYFEPINHHCHTSNPDGIYTEIETEFFNDKCDEFVEGYCYDDSRGYPAIYPWKDYNELDNAQREYEKALIAEYAAALQTVGVKV